jgi:hypothetical protein
MTANNINIDEFIYVLTKIRDTGVGLINLDMIPDDNNPSMNKLVIHPIESSKSPNREPQSIEIRNPEISTDNNDIFDSFNNSI